MPNHDLINIHAILPLSRVNGPGGRMVVFFQGCLRGCPGCFNPETHPTGDERLLSVEEIIGCLPEAGAEGITVSGGEPFLQPLGLKELLKSARMKGLSTVVYTGFTIEEIGKDEITASLLAFIDVLIDGGYMEEEKETTLLARGSRNQRFHFLTQRYTEADFIMPGKAEVTIGKDGLVTGTGFSRIKFRTNNER
ncbi:MAG: radical SAM protein [Deltaproteobacteria bacterium]|nr:radical SAM protein [Deltaproteobacteria bacterium]